MKVSEEVIDGTLQPDGSLQLEHPAQLPPGPVRVTIQRQSAAPAPATGWLEAIRQARRQMEEAGCGFMDEAEARAHIEWLRQADPIDDLLRQAADMPRAPGPP